MPWKVTISNQAQTDLDLLRARSAELYKNALEISLSVQADPHSGPGMPIKLTALGPNVWSRRVSLVHRMVYEVFSDAVVVASYRTHFEDA